MAYLHVLRGDARIQEKTEYIVRLRAATLKRCASTSRGHDETQKRIFELEPPSARPLEVCVTQRDESMSGKH